MKFKFYNTSEKAWIGMLTALKEAKKSIYWECFTFLKDEETDKIFNVLAEKAKSGVKIKIIIDPLGSISFDAGARYYLESFGVEIFYYKKRKWLDFNHRKLLIIDDRVAFLGGVNLAKDHKNWWDLHMSLDGKIVNYFVRSFAKTYYACGGKDIIPIKPLLKKFSMRVIDHWPMRKKFVLKKYYKQTLAKAEKNIFIVTPYFAPSHWLVKSLHQAVKRGVIVTVILPERSDLFIFNWANHIFASLAYKPGINFYFVKNMIHAKILLVDESEALVGSQNIDTWSFDYNGEVGVVFQRKDMIKKLKKIIDDWQAQGTPMTFKKEHEKHWYQRLLEEIFKILRPIL